MSNNDKKNSYLNYNTKAKFTIINRKKNNNNQL